MADKNRLEKMQKIMADPRYRGEHVIVVGDRVYTARTGKKAARILKELRKERPEETPVVTYIPEADSLVL